MSTAIRRYIKQLDADGARSLSMAQRLHLAARATGELVEVTPELEAECMALPEDGYGRYLLHECPEDGAVVVAMVWPPGFVGDVHDHGTWGVVGMHTGELQVASYRRVDDGSLPGHAELEPSSDVRLRPGDVGTVLPPHADIHRMVNPNDEVAISIHTYGRKAARCTTFDLARRTCAVRTLAFTPRGWRKPAVAAPRPLALREPHAAVANVMTANPHWIHADESVDRALGMMDWFSFRHLPVIEDGHLVGVLSDRDLLSATGGLDQQGRARIGRGDEGGDLTVAACMTRNPVCLEESSTVIEAAMHFLDRGIGCVPVLDRQGGLVGIVTERDVLDMFLDDAEGLGTNATPDDPAVREVMSSNPLSIAPTTTLVEAARLCRSNGMRHLPVIDADALAGIVSDRDLRRAFGKRRSPDTTVDELMQPRVVGADPDTPLSRAIYQLVRGRFSALPVVSTSQGFVGLLTTADVLDHCLEAYPAPAT